MLSAGKILQTRYQIVKALGEGGQSRVYLALDLESNKQKCVVKEMLCDDEQSPKEEIASFLNEYKQLKDLSHPLVLKVYDFFLENNSFYIVEEYIEGRTLADILKKTQIFDEQQAVQIVYDLAEALGYIHQHLIHRDIKPANIIIDTKGRARLIDFGIARKFKAGKDKDTNYWFSVGYAPPEQCYGSKQTDNRSDIYALGVLLHQFVTGIDPLDKQFALQFKTPYPKVKPVVEKATAKDPKDRYSSIEQFKKALQAASTKTLLAVQTDNLPVPTKKPLLAGLAIVLVLGILLISVVVYAVLQFENEKKIKTQQTKILFENGMAYWQKGLYDKALEEYNKAIAIDSKNPKLHKSRGDAYYMKGFYDKAIEDYTEAVTLSPTYALAYSNRGVAYDKKGLYNKAIEDFNRAILLNPKDAVSYNNRGFTYDNKKLYDQAIEDYTKAITLDPNYVKAYNNRADAYYMKGLYDKAIEDYTKAVTLNPDYVLAYSNRGITYEKKRLYDKAIADFSKVIELNPKDPAAYNSRGISYHNKGLYNEAIKDYNKALFLNPNYAKAYNNRGNVYYQKGLFNEAVKDYTRAISINPADDKAYNNRGVAYKKLGQHQKAEEDLKKAKELERR